MNDKPCAANGCGHPEDAHWEDICVVCFQQYPSDDSTVEGGVYHRFGR